LANAPQHHRKVIAPNLSMSRHDPDGLEIPAAFWEKLTAALSYAT
jgi:hypothetical protein